MTISARKCLRRLSRLVGACFPPLFSPIIPSVCITTAEIYFHRRKSQENCEIQLSFFPNKNKIDGKICGRGPFPAPA